MLERTAGCIESGSLRRLATSRKSVKSRRSLHSTFWDHGAVDIELSPLWAALIRGPQTDSRHEESPPTATATSGYLLDFLYPTGTINMLRQASGWGIDRQEAKHSRSGLGRLGQRLYTSSAQGSQEEETTASIAAEESRQSVKSLAQEKALRGYMSERNDGNFSDTWAQYLRLDEADQKRLRPEVFRYFTNSDRVVDAERAVDVFKQIKQEARTVEDYGCAIPTYLRLHNVSDALSIHRFVRDNFGAVIGVESLVGYMASNDSWAQAFLLFSEISEFEAQNDGDGMLHNVYGAIKSLPKLPEWSFGLVDFVNSQLGTDDTPEAKSDLIQRATDILELAVFRDDIDQKTFAEIIDALKLWKTDSPRLYNIAIQRLLGQRKFKFAVQTYRQNRLGLKGKLSHTTLHALLKVFCQYKSALGMQQVLDDFTDLWIKPTKFALQMCMAAFASMSDSRTVYALFEVLRRPLSGQLLTPAPVTVVDLTPILQVHARRGEVDEVVKFFDLIQSEYGVEPTMYCWNILLTAQSRAQDFEGTFTTFQTILKSPNLKPDQYTFAAMMRACQTIGDLDLVIEIYRTADTMRIRKSTNMVDCLVHAYIQDGELKEAENVCHQALNMELDGTRTQMWNALLTAYALRRETDNINRILDIMAEADIALDANSYSILMMALCMVKQPDRAYVILKRVMKKAGIRPTNFHYAVVMGGFLSSGELQKVYEVHNRMRRRGVPDSASTTFQKMRAIHLTDHMSAGTPEEQTHRAYQVFHEVVSTMDAQDITATQQKGLHDLPPKVGYPAMFYGYMLYVLAQQNRFSTVETLYKEFTSMLPKSRSPIAVLSALLNSRRRLGDFEGVEECWNIALSQARALGKPSQKLEAILPTSIDKKQKKIYPKYQLYLSVVLTQYMIALQKHGRVDELTAVINSLLDEGFLLSNKNWNYYIQILAQSQRFRLAFTLCERMFMPNWYGWQRIRHQLPERNRLPIKLRHLKKSAKFYHANYHTILYLARAHLEVQESAVNSIAMQDLRAQLEKDCQVTIRAINTMQRQADDLEFAILG
ncbi:hypothetical protein BJ878DRAFT_447658 [Calycina marina]|uniref:Pentatricopeptide repeat-containing protein n=1 Tax=Calycina marina TaxID=1763456 RepID=A0A9P8CC90_9HELO|nr:hypothetical protein BJ878DRAFT_447658 [Calycina marina]